MNPILSSVLLLPPFPDFPPPFSLFSYAKNATGYEFRFRFACIDAPETFHVPYGTYSKNNLSALVAPLGSAIDVLVYQRNDGYSR